MVDISGAVDSAVRAWLALKDETRHSEKKFRRQEFEERLESVVDHLFQNSQQEDGRVYHQVLRDSFGNRFADDTPELSEFLIHSKYVSARDSNGAMFWRRLSAPTSTGKMQAEPKRQSPPKGRLRHLAIGILFVFLIFVGIHNQIIDWCNSNIGARQSCESIGIWWLATRLPL
ncbi:MAG: hypothetical protein AAFZ99_01380 [Pseudomonadota bacterium]